MKIARALLIAAALALPVTATHFAMTSATAEAKGRKAAKGVKKAKVTKVVAKKPKRAKAARAASYKSCGTFMYSKGGKCVDARLKK